MVNSDNSTCKYKLLDILTDKQIECVINNFFKDKRIDCINYEFVRSAVKPATVGLAGFLGDHLKVLITLKVFLNEGKVIEYDLNLFIKSMPIENAPKAEFIKSSSFFRREMLMYKVFQEIDDRNDQPRWCPKAYFCNDNVVVMPDLSLESYLTKDKMVPMDLEHLLLVVKSLARFHAAFTNYDIRKKSEDYNFFKENSDVFNEFNFCDSPWLRTGAKLIANFLKEFSMKFNDVDEVELIKVCLEICDTFREYEDTANVVIHQDLWSNNLMFRYEKDVPVNLVILDYQCVRYGPPAFDLMTFIYYNTTRQMRKEKERDILKHYFDVFYKNLDETAKVKIDNYKYDFNEFLVWCERARSYGTMIGALIFPYIMMEGTAAMDTFDDSATYEMLNNVDRTQPVVAHAYKNKAYKQRLLDMFEYFVELNLNK